MNDMDVMLEKGIISRFIGVRENDSAIEILKTVYNYYNSVLWLMQITEVTGLEDTIEEDCLAGKAYVFLIRENNYCSPSFVEFKNKLYDIIKEEEDKKILSSLKNIFTEYGYDPKEEALLKIINAFNSNYVLKAEESL